MNQPNGDQRAPFHAAGSDTSAAAADVVRPVVARLARDVYNTVQTSPNGLTCAAIESVLLRSHQSVSARVYELREAGCLRDSGVRRKTERATAVVWVVCGPFDLYAAWRAGRSRKRRVVRSEAERLLLESARAYRDAAAIGAPVYHLNKLVVDMKIAAEALP